MHRLGAALALVAVGMFAPSGATVGADTGAPHPDFFRDAAPPPGGFVPETPVLRHRFVTVDLGVLRDTLGHAGDGAGTTAAFRLFDDATIETTGRFEQRPKGFSWSGRGTAADGTSQIVVLAATDAHLASVVDGDAVYADFWSGSGRYRVQNVGGPLHVISELDPGALKGTAEGPHGPADAHHDEAGPEGVDDAPTASADTGTTTTSTDSVTSASVTTQVDVLVVYTQAAAQKTGLATWIDNQFTKANDANNTSGIPFRFNKAAQAQVTFTENTSNTQSDLDFLRRTDDPYLNEVHGLRDNIGADLVVLLGSGWATGPADSCGRGYIMNTVDSSAASWAFSLADVHDGCELIVAHEMGHNMALRHDWANDDGSGSPFPYNHGFASVPGNFRTIMAYRPAGNVCTCDNIPAWSDAHVTYNGFPIGSAESPTNPHPAENDRALAQTYPTVAQFRTLQSIGGSGGTGSPGVVSWGLNRLDVFQRGPSGTLQHKWWDGTAWWGWEDLGGGVSGGPDVASWGSNRLDVFIRGTDNALWQRAWTGVGWTNWIYLGGTLTSDPAAVSWGTGRVDVVVRGTDNGLWRRYWNGIAWSGWEGLGGTSTSAPDVASWGTNRLDVFTRGTDNALWRRAWTGTAWTAWTSLGGTLQGGPGAVSWGSNRIDVFTRGTDDGLWHKYWNGSSWSGYSRLKPGGTVRSDPDAASWAAGRLDAVYRHSDGTIHRYWN